MKVSLRASNGHYVSAEPSGVVVANRDVAGPWEQFQVVDVGGGVAFVTPSGGFLDVGADQRVTARSQCVETSTRFTWTGAAVRTIQHAATGLYVAAEGGGGAELVANRAEARAWEQFRVYDWADGTPPVNAPSVPAPPDPPVHDVTRVNGNFLALPGFELDKGQIPGFMYPAMSPADRGRYRTALRDAGLVTIPFSPFARYRQWAYSLDPHGMQRHLAELRSQGVAPLAFLLTDHLDGHAWTLDEAKRHLDTHLPVWKDEAVSFALCWEIDQVRGLEHEDTQLALAAHARQHLGNRAMLWDHRQPGWWGPGQTRPGRSEWDWWRDTECNGLLGQQRLGQSWDEAKVEWFESRWNGKVRGVAGRLTQELGKHCALFEFARNTADWTARKARYAGHPSAGWLNGFC